MTAQNRTRLLGVAVLVAMFVVGGLTGAVVQRTAMADNTPPRSTQRGPSLFEMLKLTDEQQSRVCAIRQRRAEQMKPHEAAIQGVWKEHEPAIRSIIDATNAEMDSVLTADQRATKDEFRAARLKYMKERQPARGDNSKDGRRREGGRPGPGNPLGVNCPGLQDHPGPGRGQWGGDSAGPREQAPPAARPEKQQL